MLGFKIFAHAVRMVLNNWQDALRIGLVPVVLTLGAVALVLSALGVPVRVGLVTSDVPMDGRFGTAIFLSSVIWFIGIIWIFVNWHRYILLSEYPKGWMPPLRGDRIWAYFWKSFQIGLIAMLASIPAIFIAAAFGGLGIYVSLVWFAFVMYAVFRISPVMPAVAVGQPLAFGEAWRATAPGASALVLVIILLMVMDFVMNVLGNAVMGVSVGLGLPIVIICSAATSLIGVSVLTTLYGHYIEKRVLD